MLYVYVFLYNYMHSQISKKGTPKCFEFGSRSVLVFLLLLLLLLLVLGFLLSIFPSSWSSTLWRRSK